LREKTPDGGPDSMNLRTLLVQTTQRLSNGPTETPRLDAEVLLFTAIGASRTELYCRFDDEIDSVGLARFEELLARRLRGEPVSYIIGRKEFMGLEFFVDKRVMIPRPETELLVEKALEILGRRARRGQGLLTVDVGTGSGAIVVSLAQRFPDLTFYATELSSDALEVARINAAHHNVAGRIKFLEGSLLGPIQEKVDVVVSNPPYTKLVELPAGILDYEPHAALDGGPDGLSYLRDLLVQAEDRLRPRGAVLLEIDPRQRSVVTSLAAAHFPRSAVAVDKDYSGADRVVVVDCTSADRETPAFHRLRY
jgi:release factor glutamine methyltransferase